MERDLDGLKVLKSHESRLQKKKKKPRLLQGEYLQVCVTKTLTALGH